MSDVTCRTAMQKGERESGGTDFVVFFPRPSVKCANGDGFTIYIQR